MATNRTVIVYHHNLDLAIAQGLASQTEHMYPYTDAFAFGDIEPCRMLWDARCYEPVAIVQAEKELSHLDACEKAYALTQHINYPWNQIPALISQKNEPQRRVGQVIATHRADNRSSMVGDVFEVVAMLDNRVKQVTRYLCGRMGFSVFDHSVQTTLPEPFKGE